MLQLRLRKDLSTRVQSPLWLNILGVIFAIASVFADFLHFNANFMFFAALGAVICFAVSGVTVLRAMRKPKV